MKNNKVISIILFIISFLMIGYGIYFSFLTPKTAMYKALSKEIESLTKNTKAPQKRYRLSGTIDLDIDYTKVFSSEIDSYFNNNSRFFLLNMLYSFNNEKREQKAYFENGIKYIKDDSIFNNTVLSIDDIEQIMFFNKSELKQLGEIVSENMSNNFNDNNFKNRFEEVTINKNTVTAERITLSLSYEEFKDILDILKSRVESSTGLESVKEFLLSTRYNDLYQSVNRQASNPSKANLICFEYTTYISNDEIIKHEISFENNIISFGHYSKIDGNTDYELSVQRDNKEVLELIVSNDVNNTTNIEIRTDNYLIKGYKEIDDNNTNYNINLYDLDNISVSMGLIKCSYQKNDEDVTLIEISTDIVKDGKKYVLSGNLQMSKYDKKPIVNIK